LYEWLFVKTVA